jgi:hypothetical protein
MVVIASWRLEHHPPSNAGIEVTQASVVEQCLHACMHACWVVTYSMPYAICATIALSHAISLCAWL